MDVDWAAVDRYLAGESSSSEAATVRRWLLAHPGAREFLAQISCGPDGESGDESALPLTDERQRVDAAWHRLTSGRAELQAGKSHGPSERTSWPRRFGWWWLLPASAAASLLILTVTFGRRVTDDRIGDRGRRISQDTIISGVGQRLNLRLADGSRVLLAPDSRLVLGPSFGSTHRVVALEGRAYFDIAHDAVHPFLVTIDGARVRDLGTSFEMDAYPPRSAQPTRTASADSRIIVVSGAVAVENSRTLVGQTLGRGEERPRSAATMIVTAGQVMHIDPSGQATLVTPGDLTPWLGWTSGDLVFNNVSLRDALPELRRWYGVDVKLADSTLANRHITGTFHDAPLLQVIQSIALIVHARFDWIDRTITLQPRPQSHARGSG